MLRKRPFKWCVAIQNFVRALICHFSALDYSWYRQIGIYFISQIWFLTTPFEQIFLKLSKNLTCSVRLLRMSVFIHSYCNVRAYNEWLIIMNSWEYYCLYLTPPTHTHTHQRQFRVWSTLVESKGVRATEGARTAPVVVVLFSMHRLPHMACRGNWILSTVVLLLFVVGLWCI